MNDDMNSQYDSENSNLIDYEVFIKGFDFIYILIIIYIYFFFL